MKAKEEAEEVFLGEGWVSQDAELTEGVILNGVRFRCSGLSDDPFSAFYNLLKHSRNLTCFKFNTSEWETFKKELIRRVKSIHKEQEQTAILYLSLPATLKEQQETDKHEDSLFDIEEELTAILGRNFILYINFNHYLLQEYSIQLVTGDLPPMPENCLLEYSISHAEPIDFREILNLSDSNKVMHFHIETARTDLDETTIAELDAGMASRLDNLPFKSETTVKIQIHTSSSGSISKPEILYELMEKYRTCFKVLDWSISYVKAEKTELDIYVEDLKIKEKCEDIRTRIKELAPNSVIDGILDYDTYSLLPCDKPRVLWVLKEANSPENKRFTFSDLLVEDNKEYNKKVDTPTLKRVIYTSYGILNGFVKYGDMPSIYGEESEVYAAARQIAYINIKKIPGGTYANDKRIADAYRENKQLLLDQLREYRPNIVIFGNTMKYFFDDLGIKESDKVYADDNTHNTTYYVHNNVLYIYAYHPANIRVTTDVYCNEIISVARQWWQ